MTKKWLLLEGHLQQKEELIGARVPIVEIAISVPRTAQGLAFPEEEKERVLEILGLSATPLEQVPTNHEGVFFLTVRAVQSASAGDVIIRNWDGRNRDGFVGVIKEILVPVVGDVVLSVPHREVIPPVKDGKFHIFIWATPIDQGRCKPPPAMWGTLVDCRDPAFLPSREGIPIEDPETGWTVGELIENNLYIYHDLCHNGTSQELQIFDYLLKEVVKELLLSPEEKRKQRTKLAECERQRSREAYIRECGRRLQSTIDATRNSITEAERTIADCQHRIVKAVRAEAGFRKKLEQLTSSKIEVEKNFGEEFDRLLQVPGVMRVLVKDNLILVFTDQIDVEFDNLVYNIGQFRIEVPVLNAHRGIRCFNLTRTLGGYCHPHIKEDGQCCLGNIADGVAKLIGEYQYSILIQLLLQYLRTVNPSDWYYSIEHWPRAAKKTTKAEDVKEVKHDENELLPKEGE